MREAGLGEYGLRYYDDINAFAKGRYLFDTFPASRQGLALPPEWNQMTYLKQWRVKSGTIFIEGRVAPQGANYSGGGMQKYILNPQTNLLEP